MRLRLTIILLFLYLVINGQTVTAEVLMKNPDKYIYGHGSGSTIDEAEERALKSLNESISMSISSSFISHVEEINKMKEEGSEITVNEYASMVVETNAKNFLKNVEKIVPVYDVQHNHFEVYRYITRQKKDEIFESRKERALEYKELADNTLNEMVNIHQALLYYYSGLLLINSHPDKSDIKIYSNEIGKNLKLSIENSLKNAMLGVTIRSYSVKEMGNYHQVNLKATYKGKNISQMYFKYFDGQDTIKGNINNGIGVMNLYNSWYEQNEKFHLEIYYGEGKLDKTQLIEPELQSLEDFLYTEDFPRRKKIYKPSKEAEELEVVSEEIKELAQKYPVPPNKKEDIDLLMKEIVEAIKNQEFSGITNYFTETGFEQFMRIMEYGEVSVFEGEFSIKIIETGNRSQVRSIPVVIKLREPGNSEIKNEELCFIIEDGEISWINFALEDYYIEDAIRRDQHSNDFDTRLLGINFMEYYKTIFCLKQADLIEEIFSDNAQIFVGYVVRSEDVDQNLMSDLNKTLSSKNVKIDELTKSEYIDRLRNAVFPNNKHINIRFSDMQLVRRSVDPPIYAIALHQDYYSTTYSDQGYLFLLINFKDKLEPKIFFRYWQPEEFGEEDLRAIKPGFFKF